MWAFLFYAALLGLSAGFSPGPLLAVIISQTVKYGPAEGVRVALAPLLTDLPIILLGIWLLSSLQDTGFMLGVLSLIGSIFVFYLGINSLRQRAVYMKSDTDLSRSALDRPLLKGAVVNAFSPHPYLFWLTVGVPTILKAYSDSLAGALGFVLVFFFMLVGSKMMIALTVGRARQFLTGSLYLWIERVLGVLLIIFAFVLVHDGLAMTGLLPA